MGNVYQSCCLESSNSSHPLIMSSPVPIVPHQRNNIEAATEQNPVKHLNWRDFDVIKYLCKSQFGQIVLVKIREKGDGQEYAMKIIQKERIKQENLLQSSYLQNHILVQDNPFIVKVLHVSQNQKNIYILMEYIERRDLYFYLHQENHEGRPFSENLIRSIVAEAIVGLEFLHSKQIIYRELKPENLLLTNDGHIKLTDYIFSRVEKINQPTMTYLGNVQYLAPEMLEKKTGYTRSADIWSIGILLFELKTGSTPFKAEDSYTTQKRIQSGIFKYPVDIEPSKQMKDLVKRLLHTEASKRPSLEDVKRHSFFESVDWREVEQRKNKSELEELVNRYNLNQRGQEDNPPARQYITSFLRDFQATPHQFTLPTEQSFKNIA